MDQAEIYLLAYRTGQDPDVLLSKSIDRIAEQMAAYKLLKGHDLL